MKWDRGSAPTSGQTMESHLPPWSQGQWSSARFKKKALAIRVKRKPNPTDVGDALTDLFILRGPPDDIRSDNGAEFISRKMRAWIGAVGGRTAFIEPGSPLENSYRNSVNARFRDELLNGKICCARGKAQIVIERRRRHSNTLRPHSALGYRPPAPETLVPTVQRPMMHQQSNRPTRRGQPTHRHAG